MSRFRRATFIIIFAIFISGCASAQHAKSRPVSMVEEFGNPLNEVYFAALKAISLQAWEVESSNLEAGQIVAKMVNQELGTPVMYCVLSMKPGKSDQTQIEARVDGTGYLGGHKVVEKKLPTLFQHIRDFLKE